MKDINNVINVKLEEGYPNLNKIKKDIQYCKNCKRLSNDLAGYISELTSIIQYIYQSQMLIDNYPNISKTILDIAQVEMHHYMMLGEVIARVGGNPQAKNWKNCPWNGTYPNYTSNISDMLKSDIEAEEQAIEQYKYHILLIKNDTVVELIHRIIADERNHIRIFENILEEINKK